LILFNPIASNLKLHLLIYDFNFRFCGLEQCWQRKEKSFGRAAGFIISVLGHVDFFGRVAAFWTRSKH